MTPQTTDPAAGMPTCSVCIANYNGMEVIDACIQSVLKQNCDFPVEIIVHDDCSSDGSLEHIRHHYPQVTVIAGSQNVGFCVSNNRMVDVARGEYVLLLNNDAELFGDALQTLYKAAKNVGQPSILGLPQYDAATGELIDIGSTFDPFLNPIPNRDPLHNEIGMVTGACLWVPRALWHELSGFPEWFGSLAEDTYLCCAARLHGAQVRALPESGYRHWVGKNLGGGKVVASRLRTRASRRAASERNKCYVMAMTYPALPLLITLPLHILLLIAEGLVIALVKRNYSLFSGIYLNAVQSLWHERRILKQMRARLQSRRRCSTREFWRPFNLMPHKLRLLFKYGMPEIR